MSRFLMSLVCSMITCAPAAYADVMVHDPVAYETAPGMTVGAALMGLHSSADDRLVGASSPVCDKVEIHSMTEENGVMKMRQEKDGLALPADKIVKLEPTGYHLMLIGLKEPLKAGTSFDLTLKFEKAAGQTVSVPVQSRTEMKKAMDDMPEEHHH